MKLIVTLSTLIISCGTIVANSHDRFGSLGNSDCLHIEKYDDDLNKVIKDYFVFRRHIISIEVYPESNENLEGKYRLWISTTRQQSVGKSGSKNAGYLIEYSTKKEAMQKAKQLLSK